MENNQKLLNLLEESGLNEKEAAVYMTALELGQSSILDIANHSQIKRSTIYEIIPSLQNLGLLRTTKKGKKTYFLAESPKELGKLLADREKRLKEALPELLALYKSQDERPNIFFHEGREEIQILYNDTIREGKPIFNFTSIIDLYKYLDREWVDEYIKKRVQSKVITHIIAVESDESKEWADNSKEEMREIKLIPRGEFGFSGDLHVYGNKVIITTYKKHLLSVLIEDDNISTMLRMMFDMLWKKY